MPHVITALCMREGSCATVCPVECIVPGKGMDKYPGFYIDPDTCIDCGACAAECPFSAIFPTDEVPETYSAKGGERISMPAGTPGCNEPYDGEDHDGNPVHFENTRTLQKGEKLDLTSARKSNTDYFKTGPGYS
jgi:ferredoxin